MSSTTPPNSGKPQPTRKKKITTTANESRRKKGRERKAHLDASGVVVVRVGEVPSITNCLLTGDIFFFFRGNKRYGITYFIRLLRSSFVSGKQRHCLCTLTKKVAFLKKDGIPSHLATTSPLHSPLESSCPLLPSSSCHAHCHLLLLLLLPPCHPS